MKKTFFLTGILALASFQPMAHAQQINQQLACQAHLSHLAGKLGDVKATYGAGAVMSVKNGIKAYQNYLAEEHIKPGMKQFPQMQAQVDQMQELMKNNYDKQFSEPRFFTDNAMVVANCHRQFPPSSSKDEALVKGMIEKITQLANQ